jgi:hypothetical protein
VSAVVVAICFLLALAFVALAIKLVTRAGRTRAWTRVDARVLSNGVTIRLMQGEADTGDIDAYERRYRPNVTYEYVVDGVVRTGRAIAPDLAEAYGSDTWALRMIERYPVGASVAAHHDPADPASVVLEPGASRNTVLTTVVLLVLAAACVVIAVLVATDPPSVPAADFHTPN